MAASYSSYSSSSYSTPSSRDMAPSTPSDAVNPSKMMKIAIAGTNGFAQYLAYYISTTTPYQFMILSRRANEGLSNKGWQVLPTSYRADDLAYTLTGVDVVISTVTGPAQLSLIDAAASAHVGRFVPSEFCGSPSLRVDGELVDSINDNGRQGALALLRYYEMQQRMKYTVFSCGLFYERFAPNGLAHSQINTNNSLGGEGEFLVNMRSGEAMIPFQENPVNIAVTSARDAARYVVAALDLPHWPSEFTFCAQRLSLMDLITICERVKGSPIQWLPYDNMTLLTSLTEAQQTGDDRGVTRFSQMLAVAEGRYDLVYTDLDSLVDVTCEPLEGWLRHVWSPNP